jgi:hypothetical protein
MQFRSPLSNLSEILNELHTSAKDCQETLKRSEASTRAVLIDPVLRSLGWDAANTKMVEVEKSLDNLRADYLLCDVNSIAKIIVEAKALGTDLDDKSLIKKLVSYAFNFELNDVFLTDGLVWKHFDNFQPGDLSPSKVLDLAKDDHVTCAAYFVQHLDAAKYWPINQSIDVLSQRIDELENTVSNLQKKIDELNPKPPETHDDFIALTDLDEIVGKKPSHFRLPDGKIVEINTWKDILRESCKFVLAHNPLINIPFPDRVGKRVFLFSLYKPATKVSFVTELYNGQKIFIYLNYDSQNCVANALYVLEKTPKEVSKFAPAIIIRE